MIAYTVSEVVSELVEKIVKQYLPVKVILFGSYANGFPDEDSDIDLLIIKQTDDRPIDRRVAIRKIVSSRDRKIPFDALVLTPEEIKQRLEIGDQFIKEILECGKVLYAA